jgi:hypothetical protein
MGGSCGEPKGSTVQSRYANPHESAHPIGVGGAENINRLDWSNTMKRTSKGASAPSLSVITNPQYVRQQQPTLKKFELRYNPESENKYRWELLRGWRGTLDEQAISEIDEAAWALLARVEEAADRAKKRLRNLRPVPSPRSSNAGELTSAEMEVQHG